MNSRIAVFNFSPITVCCEKCVRRMYSQSKRCSSNKFPDFACSPSLLLFHLYSFFIYTGVNPYAEKGPFPRVKGCSEKSFWGFAPRALALSPHLRGLGSSRFFWLETPQREGNQQTVF